MISNEQYATLIRAMKTIPNIQKSSKIAGMHRNTASKYLRLGKSPHELNRSRKTYKRPSPIHQEDWEEIKEKLEEFPDLDVTALMEYLVEKYPHKYSGNELRSLQRKVKDWRVLFGSEREVMFWQEYRPGERSQSDFIHMDYLNVTIGGKPFNHLIFHFVLPYSGWENLVVCEGGESFMNLCNGMECSLWKLGAVAKIHRTDNLTAAINPNTREFNQNWTKLCNHYNIEATVNNPGKSNENGKVERSNGVAKRNLENHLYLRGSKDFRSIEEYQSFLTKIADKGNKRKAAKVSEEMQALQLLPKSKWYRASKIPVRVHTDGTIRVEGVSYSVPSRTIGSILSAYLYPEKIEVYYGKHFIQSMQKLQKGEHSINFMHIIPSLIRKPGAFEDYKYKESLYPSQTFRMYYEKMSRQYKSRNKNYVKMLYMASIHGVEEVSSLLSLFLKKGLVPSVEDVKKRLRQKTIVPNIEIKEVNIGDYDELIVGCANGH